MMKILVCITHVPDTTSRISFTDGDTRFNSQNVQYIIGPYDEYALSRAIELKETLGGTVTVFNVGEADTEASIRKALALGADDAIRVNASPSDSWFVAEQIAHHAKNAGYDLIMMGRESIDYNGSVVHSLTGALIGVPAINKVMHLDISGDTAHISREIDGGKEKIEGKLPLILGCQEPIAEWKIPNMRGIMAARTKPLQVIEPVASSLSAQVSKYELPPAKSGVKLVDASEPEKLIDLLRNEAKII